ncbi:MAG: glycosyltransferase family 39 protein, partial [Chloroflexi bacterium]|nr:glycosyltransferase family 39 protein [Chloroflexota bacterium]
MTNTASIWKRLRSIDPAFAGVMALAAALRYTYIGMHHVIVDEVSVLIPALRLSRHGEWTWAGWNTASFFLPRHSPLTVYLAAIPYLFSPDPRAVRLWVATLGIVAVGLMYWTASRYFGRTAGLVVGLLLAAHVPLVDWSRFSWNTNYGQVFIAGWILTGLLGYFQGRRWAQTLHWLALSGAIQSHPGNGLLGPISVILIAGAWLRNKSERPALVRATLWGWALFAVSLVPWAIGLATLNSSAFSAQHISNAATQIALPKQSFNFNEMTSMYSSLIASTDRRMNPALYNGNGLYIANSAPGNWWPPAWFEYVFKAQSGLTAIALSFMLVKGCRRSANIPFLVLALVGLWPLISFVISPIPVAPSYLMALIFGAVPSLGVGLALVADSRRWLKPVVFAVVVVFVVSQSWLTLATMRDHQMLGNAGRFDAPLDTYLSALKTWQSAGQGRETIILAERDEGKRTPYVQDLYWSVVVEGQPARILRMDVA